MKLVGCKYAPPLTSVFVGRGPVEQCSICAAHSEDRNEIVRFVTKSKDDDGEMTIVTQFIHVECLRVMARLYEKVLPDVKARRRRDVA